MGLKIVTDDNLAEILVGTEFLRNLVVFIFWQRFII